MNKANVVFWALVLSACAASGPIYQAAPEPKETDALVYIYRPSIFNSGGLQTYDASFSVNEVNVVRLSVEGYSWFHIPAGDYKLTQGWSRLSGGGDKLAINAKWLPRQKYYYRFETYSGYSNLGVNQLRWRVSRVPEDRALAEIVSCKYQQALGVEKLLDQLTNR